LDALTKISLKMNNSSNISMRYAVGKLLVVCTLASVNAFHVPSPAAFVGSIGNRTPSIFKLSPPRRSVSVSISSTYEQVPANDDVDQKSNLKIVKKEKKSSSPVVSTTFNLMKAIIGSGVLALPAGLATMSDQTVR
jgi:hypothetical protein